MDPNVLCVVSTTRGAKCINVHALDISDVSTNFTGPIHTFPPPVLSLPTSSSESRKGYPSGMSFGNIGSKLYLLGGYSYPKKSRRAQTSSSSSSSLEGVPSLDVFVFDLSSHSMSKGPSLNSHKGRNPIVIPFGNKLFVIPRFLDATSMIEVLDDSESAWVPIPLPPGLFEMPDGLVNYDPVEIIAYGKQGSEVLLCLATMEFGDLTYNVDTQEWRLPCSERAPSEILMRERAPCEMSMRAPIILDSFAINSYSDISSKFLYYTNIDREINLSSDGKVEFYSPIPLAGYHLVKHGEQNLVSFSWSPSPDPEKESVGSQFRVDMLVVSDQHEWPANIYVKIPIFVAAKVFEHDNDNSEGKPAEVHYCYLPHQGN